MRIGSLPIPLPQELQGLFDASRPGKTGAPKPAEGLVGTQPGQPAEKSSFSNLLEHAVSEVDAKMKGAAAEQTKVLTGETNNLHQAMIAMQEASTAFSLMVEVRNKLVESYQEIMRMQV